MKRFFVLPFLVPAILPAEPVSFEREVMPLLELRCGKCHRPEEQRGGLDLTRIETMLRGGDDLGAALVPGMPDESPLLQVLTGAKEPAMPKKGEKLPAGEIDTLRRWIAEGAKDDTPVFPAEDVAFFERDIRPVLAERCFRCHAGDEPEHGLRLTSRQGILTGGERGPAAVAGKPEASLLMKAIRHEGELKMPRNGDRLPAAGVSAFERWIALGLPWPAKQKVLARERQFTISDAERNHWAFCALPGDLPAKWSIDSALSERHARGGLKPAPEADRYRLLRRMSYDLIGHPPTPEEITAFVNDAGPDAYEKVVTRLLDSPHFGWRWGRHWLDHTRNGANQQSNRGPAFDKGRYTAFVAQCFNEDRPWDWFARVHVAGDKMQGFGGGDYSVDQALAAAVPLNGQRTFEEVTTQTFVLMDKLDEGIEFMGRSLMGISLECARCHDHKFDPVSQRDYYGLLGFFQSSWYAPVPVATMTRAEAETEVARHRDLLSEQARLGGYIRRQGLELNVGGGGRVKTWQQSRTAVLAPLERRLKELEAAVLRAELADAESKGKAALAKDTRTALAECEAKVGDFTPAHYDVAVFKEMGYFIGGHKSQRGLIKRASALGKTELARDLEQQADFWEKERLSWVKRSRFGGHAKSDPEVAELAKADARIQEISGAFSVNPAQPWVAPRETHLYVRADGGLRRAEDLAALDEQAKAAGLQFNSNNPERVWLHPFQIGDSRLLARGDVMFPGEVVPRATPVFFGEPPGNLEGSGRLQLAEWLTAPGSTQAALVARAQVNRAWQHLFGEALCRSPKELGRLGTPPELPEVIDGLAARFVAGGWSTKKLVREIVLSAAYRRSALAPPEEVARDPENRFFARQSVRRLEYEPIMNTMAWLREGRRFDDPATRDAAVPGATEYAGQFDAPNVYEVLDRRTASISATQALLLMNHPQTANEIAGTWMRRLGIDGKDELAGKLDEIFLHLLQRRPATAERDFAERFVERRRRQSGGPDPRDEIREFLMLLLCGNEILYLE